MLRYILTPLAAVVLLAACLIPEDADARGRGGAGYRGGGAGYRGGAVAVRGGGYGHRGYGYRRGYGAAAVGAAAVGAAAYGAYGYANRCYYDRYGQYICPQY